MECHICILRVFLQTRIVFLLWDPGRRNILKSENLANLEIFPFFFIFNQYFTDALAFKFVTTNNCTIYPIDNFLQLIWAFIKYFLYIFVFVLKFFLFTTLEIICLHDIWKNPARLNCLFIFFTALFNIIVIEVKSYGEAMTINVINFILVKVTEHAYRVQAFIHLYFQGIHNGLSFIFVRIFGQNRLNWFHQCKNWVLIFGRVFPNPRRNRLPQSTILFIRSTFMKYNFGVKFERYLRIFLCIFKSLVNLDIFVRKAYIFIL